MNVLLIFAHPNIDSFNRAILDTVETTLKAGHHEIITRDLYGIDFQAALSREDFTKLSPDIAREQEHIKWADALVFIYPVWWWDRPAILKGYIDRVFTYGFAFQMGPEGATGLLHHQKALVIQTLGTAEQTYDENPGAIEAVHRSMSEGTLEYCGVKNVEQLLLFGIGASTPDDRGLLLTQVATVTAKAFPGIL
ncbi:MAG: NAD(P)H-dependent oxidoreductase [Bacteroidetes bacterium]|nr:NAD(P)H-dependent oxidoreductase [Bacteroidota bacterium]